MAAVPITAHSVCNALGPRTEAVLEALFAGRGGVSPAGDATTSRPTGVLCFEPEPLRGTMASYDTRQGRLAAHVAALLTRATASACRRWGAHRVGVIIGSSTGGIAATEQAFAHHRVHGSMPEPWSLERAHAMHATIEVLRHVAGARGPAFAVSTACSSSGKALGSAQRLIETDVVDAVLVAGIDTLCETTLRGFASLEVLSASHCRPFSSARQGINIGEGAAALLLERTGDASVALVSVGESSDAHHISAPHPEGVGARLAMQRALAQAGVTPGQVGHINAHATATVQGDIAEARAIREVFGREVPVVATKGYTGHLLGAAGATEAVFAAVAIEQGWLPAGLGCGPVDPQLELHVVCERTQVESDYAMSTSFAFGGSNVAVLLGARDP